MDIWDYLGWKDTLADPPSIRPRAGRPIPNRAAIANDYTPQMVVNGGSHVLGSNSSAIEKAIAQEAAITKAAEFLSVPGRLTTTGSGDQLTVKLPERRACRTRPPCRSGRLPKGEWTVMITRGENKGPHRHLSQRGAALGRSRRVERQDQLLEHPSLQSDLAGDGVETAAVTGANRDRGHAELHARRGDERRSANTPTNSVSHHLVRRCAMLLRLKHPGMGAGIAAPIATKKGRQISRP